MLSPLPSSRWNFSTAAHLLNRAGFGGSPADIVALVRMGPEAAVAHLVDYEQVEDPTPAPPWAKPDPERAARLRAARRSGPDERRRVIGEDQRLQRQRMMELRHWWLRRMRAGPRPLQEKMALFWHGHFATGFRKVTDAYLMWRQNETFRVHATGNWRELVTAATQEPAMLIYLDQAQSRRGKPNENLARELMELFTLGEGHYTEQDVLEAARALTGWSLDKTRQQFQWRPRLHDDGEKELLGKRGRFDGEDLVRLIVEQPQSARYLTAKLWTWFAGTRPSPEVNEALASAFRESDGNLKELLRLMFLSTAFYEPEYRQAQVKSPVIWLVAACRQLELPLPPPLLATRIIASLGQDLFLPPSVKGWDEGLSWISTGHLQTRYQLAGPLVRGEREALRKIVLTLPADSMTGTGSKPLPKLPAVRVKALFTADQLADRMKLLAAVEQRLLQGQLQKTRREALVRNLEERGAVDADGVRELITGVMMTPEYQLC
jgi:uncharacterized protein (DUF1800 family)